MKDAKNPDETETPGHGQSRPTGPDRQEQYRRTREQAASGQEEQDRDARIRRRAHEMWEAEGRPEGQADRHWSRAAEDLDREDAAIQREGIAGEKPGARPKGDDRGDLANMCPAGSATLLGRIANEVSGVAGEGADILCRESGKALGAAEVRYGEEHGKSDRI